MGEFRQNERWVSVADYLRDEDRRTIRHEYLRGEVYAMSGGTLAHSQIAANILAHLHGAARRNRCSILASDFKVQTSDEAVYYPDVVVLCRPHDRSAVLTEAPSMVVEVTSRSTARIDRGEKLQEYLKNASLETYLVVDQFQRRVTRHWRDAGEWRGEELVGVGSIPIACLRSELTLDQIYESVEMPPLRVGEPESSDEFDEYAVDE